MGEAVHEGTDQWVTDGASLVVWLMLFSNYTQTCTRPAALLASLAPLEREKEEGR